MTNPTEIYLVKIESDFRSGKATEHTYRSSLEALLEAADNGIEASNDPKHVACGAPDFIVERRKVPLGYVETKDIGADLDKVEKSDQMRRYLKALNNLILTDYLEFRWYVNGERKLKIRIAQVGKNNRLVIVATAAETIAQLLNDFYATEAPTVNTPKELAQRLAGVTHFIRDQIIAVLTSGDPELKRSLEQQYKTFVELLLPELTHIEFADLYAQAITYGLFAAKLTAPESIAFAFEDAYKYLRGNPFLRRLFLDVNDQLDEIDIIRPYLEDIVSLLNRADFHSILADFGKRTRTEDPVVHFYETFLATYDPKLRESRGVYYTPEPVVQFIVNSVDKILRTRFSKTWGLADENVKVLDPATGTGTFLFYVIKKIQEEVVNTRDQSGQWASYSKRMLNRIFGFELLIAPYVVSHLKLGLLMNTLGTQLESKDDRIHIYLTNALEKGVTKAETLAGLGYHIAQESNEAAIVKKLTDIMVVIGNPPYSNYGQLNKNPWIDNLLEDYKKDLDEKKININDDYIKFLRFGQWKIDQTGQGVLAFITNNSFLNGITHRRMREALMHSFADIYILDLHGSPIGKNKPIDIDKDENVFDIKQSVSINIFIKHKGTKPSRVHYFEIWGTRQLKYNFLSNEDISTVNWRDVEEIERSSCLGTFRFFTPKGYDYVDEYCLGWPINKIFSEQNTGIQTKRDDLFIDFDKSALSERFRDIALNSDNRSYLKHKYSLEDSSGWSINKLANIKYDPQKLVEILYRPFDIRWIYYDTKALGRSRESTMRHMLTGNNLGFITLRINGSGDDFVVLATENIIEKGSLPRGNYSIFPLYLYTTPEDTKGTLFAQEKITRRSNLTLGFIHEFSKKLGIEFLDGSFLNEGQFGPEDVFYYAYSVFHSSTFRHRYEEYLEIDYPRLPLTGDKELFFKLVMLGKELVELHLLKSPKVDEYITSFPEVGSNKVDKVIFSKYSQATEGEINGQVWLNEKQYFGEVPEKVWNFNIGGYQVCDKWLKDRKLRILSSEEINHYQKMIVAIKNTIYIMEEIEQIIPGWPIR